MALNWAMLSPDRAPIPLPDELIIRTVDVGVDLTVTIPNAPPTGSVTSGGSGGAKKMKEMGRLFLTDQRLIFVADASQRKPTFESLSIPLTSLLSSKFEQPLLGSNYLVLDIKPATAGGLKDGTRAEIRMKEKGIFEFASTLDKTRERAVYMKRQQADEEEGLPTYSTPAGTPGLEAGPSNASYTGGVPSELPPAYE
ncbi:hypothetical protein EUX98_g2266 [Antrodiella citrinella]|uniref:GRAM domain-containing protein n=1 Tax=Antrodiella citrinella TaxID=2447956 RepID=A0A4S4MZD4_9APHY|nr:hypothetical protein EUX98_g2266 [Antrodiella citrinella]